MPPPRALTRRGQGWFARSLRNLCRRGPFGRGVRRNPGYDSGGSPLTTMPGYQPYTPLRPRQGGFGIASLVLSLVAVATLLLCGLGMIVALAGLVLGVLPLVRVAGRTQAVIGITLSYMALAAVTFRADCPLV